ncbi:curli production assembly/transport protein CsgE [Shewanella sp. TC10]|uniref:curli production assembly/transport protein CsgE n=1 Tax=Shewanella sp. TC10 TaxID=1419739 RepID=UPI001E41CDBE|nr:curli production assembly/transport protein CsgE [Shewanella sp. TC10]
MRNISLMFYLILISAVVNAETNVVVQPSVNKVSVSQNEGRSDSAIDQTQVERLENADAPKTSATDKNLQKKIQARPIDISDAIPRTENDLIDGLILNRAMTRLGHRFYRDFVSSYRDIGGDTKHSGITVIEQATARSGSKILIQQNRKTIFVTFVSPISRNIDAQASYAAKKVNATIKKVNERALLGNFFDPDLAPDEI